MRASLVLLLLLAACGARHTATFAYAQADGGCPGTPAPTLTSGMTANGGGCDGDADCVTTCCSCVNKDGRSYLARACADGICNTTEACGLAFSATLCP